jgi:hypothetical protein
MRAERTTPSGAGVGVGVGTGVAVGVGTGAGSGVGAGVGLIACGAVGAAGELPPQAKLKSPSAAAISPEKKGLGRALSKRPPRFESE